MTNIEKFTQTYIEVLTEAITKNPHDFDFKKESIPNIVEKMVLALSKGDTTIQKNVKVVCKRLGIKANKLAILEYLQTKE